MKHHGSLRDEEATAGAWEAGRGAAIGATKVRTYVGYFINNANQSSGVSVLPYLAQRCTDFRHCIDHLQFNTRWMYHCSGIWSLALLTALRFIQMSGMILGGCLDADRRLREYEAKVRVRKRLGMDQTAWEQYELEFAEMRAREQRAAAAAANKDN